ncbi:MAG: zinc-dependent metalloprotease [Bdellovibrionales bacterium]|nr:zinc-dependent metalloprotease [Bdellovibrionales bacterium]
MTACVGKRPEQNDQGNWTDIVSISSIDSKEYPITTGPAIGQGLVSSAELSRTVDEGTDELDSMPVVNISIPSTGNLPHIPGDVAFRGRPNTQGVYSLYYKATDKYVMLYKVAKRSDIPAVERPYINPNITFEDGRVAVPMAGYQVDYYRDEKRKNEFDEQSNIVIQVPAPRAEATLAKISRTSGKQFAALKMVDVFPKSHLDGEWYFAETIVETSVGASDAIGQTLNVVGDSFLDLASRVRFKIDQNTVKVVSVSQDERVYKRKRCHDGTLPDDQGMCPDPADPKKKIKVAVDQSDVLKDVKTMDIVTIPAISRQPRVSATDELASEEDNRINWKNKKLVQLGLGNSVSISDASMNGELSKLSKKVATAKKLTSDWTADSEDLEGEGADSGQTGSATSVLNEILVGPNHLNYTIIRTLPNGAKIKVAYSFVRVDTNSKFVSKRHFKEDRARFGFFTTAKPFIQNFEIYTQEDVEKRIQLSRHDMKALPGTQGEKGITFHFTKGTPEWLRKIGRDAVAAWDRAFKAAYEGTGEKVAVRVGTENGVEKDVELGDIRYNVINLIDEIGESRLFGFGPSVTDPLTGEIISATSNVHIESVRDAVTSAIREYIVQSVEGRLEAPLYSELLKTKKPPVLASASTTVGSGVQSIASAGGTSVSKPVASAAKSAVSKLQTLKMASRMKALQEKFLELAPGVKAPASAEEFEEMLNDMMSQNKSKPGISGGLLQGSSSSSIVSELASLKKSVADLKKMKASFQAIDRAAKAKAIAAEFGPNHWRCSSSAQISLNNLQKDIEKLCSTEMTTVLGQAVSSVKNGRVQFSGLDPRPIDTCASRLIYEKALATLIHEMGHNLGLRHNFKGSVDKDNFPEIEFRLPDGTKEVRKVRSSSIMEYTSLEEDRLTEAGPYDIAAIRFGYADRVKMEDGKVLKVDTKKSLDAQFGLTQGSTKGSVGNIAAYQFCTDEDTFLGYDALCRLHDAGVTPLEIVETAIASTENVYHLTHFRRDRNAMYNPVDRAYGRTYDPLKRIYEEWRFILADYLQRQGKYLENYDSTSYEELLKKMEADKDFGEKFKLYRPAAVKAYEYFRNTAFTDNHMCAIQHTKRSDIGTRYVEFQKLHDLIFDRSRGSVIVRSCLDLTAANVAPYLAEVMGKDFMPLTYKDKATGTTIALEVGRQANTLRYDRSPLLEDVFAMDIIGNSDEKLVSYLMLTDRDLGQFRNVWEAFAPNFLDEPTFREDIYAKTFNRLINGVVAQQIIGKPKFQPLFTYEQDLLKTMSDLYYSAMLVPNKDLTGLNMRKTMENLGPLDVYVPRQGENIKGAPAVLEINGRVAYIARDQGAEVTIGLIEAYNNATQLLSAQPISDDQTKEVVAWVNTLPKAASLQPGSTAIPTVGDMTQAVDSFGGMAEKAGPAAQCFLNAYGAAIGGMDPWFAALDAAMQAAGDDQAKVDALMKTDLVAFGSASQITDPYTLVQESFTKLDETMKKCQADAVKTIEKVELDRKDLEDQQDMILKILQSYAS